MNILANNQYEINRTKVVIASGGTLGVEWGGYADGGAYFDADVTLGSPSVYIDGIKQDLNKDYTFLNKRITWIGTPPVEGRRISGYSTNTSEANTKISKVVFSEVNGNLTEGQTVFTFAYTPYYIDVMVNGIELIDGVDFTADNGDYITLLGDGLTLGDTMVIKVMGIFAVNDLFDRTEMNSSIGNVMSPLLDLPLKNSLSMRSGVGSVSFERATPATYIDRYGVLKYAEIDEPRFEKEGFLVEGESINYIQESEDMSLDLWTYTGTKTVEQLAPDGTLTAVKFSGIDTDDVTQTTFSTEGDMAGRIFTESFWVKGDIAGALTVQIRNSEGTKVTVAYEQVQVTTEWTRVAVTCDGNLPTTTSDHSFYLNIKPNINITDFYIWGVQIEEKTFATSYIPTTDAVVTRSGELCSITASGNTPHYIKGNDISITLDLIFKKSDSVGNHVISHSNETGTTTLRMYTHPDGLKWQYANDYDTGAVQVSHYSIEDTLVKLAKVVKDGIPKSYTNAELIHTADEANYDTKPTIDYIYIGKFDDKANTAYFHIKNFRIYDTALTDAEIALS